MLLYNTLGDIFHNVEFLNTKIKERISKQEILYQFNLIDGFQYSYISSHQRISNSIIDIYSSVFDYKDIIEKKWQK